MNKFNRTLLKILKENNIAGDGGAFGMLQPTAGEFSGDNYATGDYRTPKIIGNKPIRRTFPELTVFSGKVSKKNGKQKQDKGKNGRKKVRKSSK